MSNKQTLKYLFTAELAGGDIYIQNPEDISTIEPDKRSCFFDLVKAEEAGNRVEKFTLKGEGHTYAVDLRDGHFEVDGVPFMMHEAHLEDIPGEKDRKAIVNLKDFRLVFFRQHTHDIQQMIKDKKVVSSDETSHRIVYRMGWQCTVNGRNYQEIMQIK